MCLEQVLYSSDSHPLTAAVTPREGDGRSEGASEEPQLTSEDLESIIQDLREQGPFFNTSEEGGGANEVDGGMANGEEVGVLGGVANEQPWEPKTQGEDNMRKRQGQREKEGKKGKIWSFLEEKTRVSEEERAHAVGSKSLSSPPPQQPSPVRYGVVTMVQNERHTCMYIGMVLHCIVVSVNFGAHCNHTHTGKCLLRRCCLSR